MDKLFIKRCPQASDIITAKLLIRMRFGVGKRSGDNLENEY